MKTRYILHGGFASLPNKENDKFFKEILKNTPQNIRILLVFFSKDLDRISVNQAEDVAQFEKNKGVKKIYFELANETDFENQIKRSDAVYFHGGSTAKLLKTLRTFSNLKKLFQGKVVAGESAGANALSTYFYSEISKESRLGIGLIKAKIICHYSGQNSEKLNKGPRNIEEVLLPEYKYKLFEE